jgi:hypothetical protein
MCARRGLTIVEAVVVVICCFVVCFVALPVLFSPPRINSRVMASQSNMRQLAIGQANFAANHDDSLISFSADDFDPAAWPELHGVVEIEPTDGIHEGQVRLTEILRRATGRYNTDNAIEVDDVHLAQNRYLHVPLIDTMTGQQPEPVVISPMDVNHQDFQEYTERADYDRLPGGRVSDSFGSWTREQAVNRWAYASSYQSTIYAWSPDELAEGESRLPVRASADGMSLVVDRDRAVASRRMDEVVFPSAKAMFFEEFDYTAGQGPDALHCSDPGARVNVQFFDSSVRRITTTQVTPGWDASSPCDPDRLAPSASRAIDTRYFPDASDALGPRPYRWTRGGLKGIDVGGNAIDTSGWCEN